MNTSAAIGPDHTIRKSDNFVESSVDGEAILMHLDEGNFSSLKSTGLRIWEMLDEPRRVSQICEGLMAEFEVDESVCRQQTVEFLEGLRARGLIEVEDGS